MQKKSIMVDIRALGQSGLGRYVEDVVVGILPELENVFEVILLIDCKIPIEKMHSYGLFDYKHEKAGMLSIVSKKYDFCWFPTLNQPLFGPRNRILSVHDLAQLKWETASPRLVFRALATYILNLYFLKKAVVVMFNSDFTRTEYGNYYKETLDRIPNLNVVNLTTCKKHKPIRAKHIVNNSLLFVGNLKYTKNLKILINAVNLISNANLTIVTSGAGKFIDHDLKYLENINPKKIKMLSNLTDKDLVDLYSKSDLLILPSLYEGWGYTPYEALDQGCNILVSNIPPLNKVFKNPQIFFDPKDEVVLTKMISNYFALTDNEKDSLFIKTFNSCKVRTLPSVRKETINSILKIVKTKVA
ncbi:glycosyltransferase [Amylibacter sp.]|nr:glycosyltransferase [Amylibacter sp.]